tara:strand:+ start:816 stop:1418 length:603 start_codon:yes stop_codon:yes gene_type:complete
MQNKMIIHDVEQGTEAWFNLRLGKFSGSNFGKLFMSKTTAGYNDLINEVAFKLLTGKQPEGDFASFWMERGTELEPFARKQYEAYNGVSVEQVGFCTLSDSVGCSPDGLIGTDGMLEIKCPKWSTLINLKLKPKIEKGYFYQIHGSLWVTGRQWCDYFVYHPDLEPYQERIERDETVIESIKKEVDLAIIEVNKRLEKIR